MGKWDATTITGGALAVFFGTLTIVGLRLLLALLHLLSEQQVPALP